MMSQPSGLPDHVGDFEPLARFLTSSNHFSSSCVKQGAFLPSRKDGATSVARHDADSVEMLKSLSQQFLTPDRPAYGAGVLSASIARQVGLDVIADEPPPRHANIVKWDWFRDDWELKKAKRKEQAMHLARHSQLIRFD